MPNGSQRDPSSVVGLIFRIIRRPALLLTLICVVAVAYVGARVAGYDLLPAALEKVGLNTFPKAIDITGSWRYRCIAIGQNYRHGGTATIEEHVTPFGVEWKLSGSRRWVGSLDDAGHQIATSLPTAFYWETDWAAITASKSIKFTYSITTSDGNIKGYGFGNIEAVNGVPQEFKGEFYQLPPYKAMHGTFLFRRMANEADIDPITSE
jgi:hypothetical protein